MMCYEKCCRMCLKELEGPGYNCLDIREINDSLRDLFQVEVTSGDITKCICDKCFEQMMNYKAFKRTVQGCQKVIKDYELIRNKILASRTSIKHEVVDLTRVKMEPNDTQSISRGLPSTSTQSYSANRQMNDSFSRAFTDSQINDVLDMVHEKRQLPVSSSTLQNASKRQKMSLETTSQAMTEVFVNVDNRNEQTFESQLNSSTVKSSKTQNREATNRLSVADDSERTNSTARLTRSANENKRPKKQNNETTPTANLDTSDSKNFSKQLPDTTTPRSANNKSTNDSVTKNQNSTSKVKANGEQANKPNKREDTEAHEEEPPSDSNSYCSDNSTNLMKSQGLTKSRRLRGNSNQIMKSPLATASQAVDSKLNNEVQNSNLKRRPSKLVTDDKSLNKSVSQKRSITITLLKMHETVNFKYCDQFKNNIEFDSITSEELKETRESLLLPDVWNNLIEAFKRSPPGAATTQQLQIILGDKFDHIVRSFKNAPVS